MKGIAIRILFFLLLSIILILFYIFHATTNEVNTISGNNIQEEGEEVERTYPLFLSVGLKTDASSSSISLGQILSGGPGKDGIPALTDPSFVSVSDADVGSDVRGIFLTLDGEERFYPYSILVWHEIVNDVVAGIPIAITFCPLCDSGIVFDRRVSGEVLEFGVSGLLFESNLLMYDRATESLWSQARGEAVVGDYTGTSLTYVPFQLLSFAEVKASYPNVKVLSRDTGYSRNYDTGPYQGYLETEDIIFPVSVSDKRFFAKELFFILPFENTSYAFEYATIPEGMYSVGETGLVLERNGERFLCPITEKDALDILSCGFRGLLTTKTMVLL